MKIYAVNMETFGTMQEDNWSEWIDLVDCTRREKIDRLKQENDKIQSLGAGLLLRYSFLQEGYSVKQWEQIQIQADSCGKPRLVQYPEFCYSLSHSGTWVICGVHSKALGADIQEMRPWNMKMAKRFFAAEEYDRLQLAREEERQRMFYQMWTAKESYVKFTGDGIGKGISQHVVSKDFNRIMDQEQNLEAGIKIYETIPGYMLCACTMDGKDFPGKIRTISVEDLK